MLNKKDLSVCQYSCLRLYFKDLLASKSATNSRLTKSTFSRSLGISLPALSNFLDGRRNFSRKTLLTISKKLKWSHHELNHAHSLSVTDPEIIHATAKVNQRQHVSPTQNAVTLDLISRCLLEGIRIPKFSENPLLLGRGLGFSEALIQRELDALVEKNLIHQDEAGKFRRDLAAQLCVTDSSHESIRSFYRQMCSLASTKIRADNVHRRYFGSETFAFDPSLLPEARETINRCLDELAALAERSPSASSIYHTNIQLFDLLEGA